VSGTNSNYHETKTIGTLNKTVLVSHNSFIRDFTYSSPACSKATEEEYWASSVSNPPCTGEERGEDTLQSSDILAKGLNDILNDNYK